MIKIEFMDRRQIRAFTRDLRKAVEGGISRGLYRTGFQIRRDIRQRITRPPKTGRVYHRHGRRHRASAAGESPANETGALKGSFSQSVGGNLLQVNSDDPKLDFLEFGTGKMEPRPLTKPSLDANIRNAEVNLETEIIKRISKIKIRQPR